jgi:hypothetical protein
MVSVRHAITSDNHYKKLSRNMLQAYFFLNKLKYCTKTMSQITTSDENTTSPGLELKLVICGNPNGVVSTRLRFRGLGGFVPFLF